MNSGKSGNGVAGYEARVASEIEIYRDCTEVHNLPPIFHYWSNRHLVPKLRQHGFTDPAGMFLLTLERQCAAHPGATVRILSAGSGNCDLEVGIASGLRARGHTDFIVECLDLNPDMLRRGADGANRRGVGDNMEFVEADLNRWAAQREYHAVIADQSLHHVLELESLFGEIRRSLRPDGVVAISDMIGRNGHLRWPAALAIVREFWRKLPPSYRRNCQSGRYEAFFEDADCSTESFEGIRAQDIAPLLAEYFDFRLFLGFGNVIDPFVDRSFGPHFDPEGAWDREFIDEVHRRDEAEIAAGVLQPTHMLAVLGKQGRGASVSGAPPAVAASAAEAHDGTAEPVSAYDWGSWPMTDRSQLENACRILEDSANRIKALEKELETAVADMKQCETEFQARTAWALRLDEDRRQNEEELFRRAAWGRKLEAELAERTEWALRLDGELAERTQWALRLERELAERTKWALSLEAELDERIQWALRSEREPADRARDGERRQGGILGFLRRPLKIADRLRNLV